MALESSVILLSHGAARLRLTKRSLWRVIELPIAASSLPRHKTDERRGFLLVFLWWVWEDAEMASSNGGVAGDVQAKGTALSCSLDFFVTWVCGGQRIRLRVPLLTGDSGERSGWIPFPFTLISQWPGTINNLLEREAAIHFSTLQKAFRNLPRGPLMAGEFSVPDLTPFHGWVEDEGNVTKLASALGTAVPLANLGQCCTLVSFGTVSFEVQVFYELTVPSM